MSTIDLIQSKTDLLPFAALSEQIEQIRAAEPEISKLVAAYIQRALTILDLAPENSMCDVTGQVTPSHGYWLAHLREIAAAHGRVLADPAQLHASLLKRLPFFRIELDLIGRIGPRLAEIANGRHPSLALELLFQDDLMARWYRDGLTFQAFYRQIKSAMEVIRETARAPLNVLEVGAGTGGLTYHLRELLSETGAYFVYSDISRYFLRHGKATFSGLEFMYQVFDLERSHTDQHLPKSQFDVVLANDVVHDTKNVDFSLANIKSLLRPGGFLLMIELVAPKTWWPMCFGALDGWWRFKLDSSDGRKGRMILSDEQWLERLKAAGYVDARNLSKSRLPDFDNCVLIARNPNHLPASIP